MSQCVAAWNDWRLNPAFDNDARQVAHEARHLLGAGYPGHWTVMKHLREKVMAAALSAFPGRPTAEVIETLDLHGVEPGKGDASASSVPSLGQAKATRTCFSIMWVPPSKTIWTFYSG